MKALLKPSSSSADRSEEVFFAPLKFETFETTADAATRLFPGFVFQR